VTIAYKTTRRHVPAMSPARDERRTVTSFDSSSPSFTRLT